MLPHAPRLARVLSDGGETSDRRFVRSELLRAARSTADQTRLLTTRRRVRLDLPPTRPATTPFAPLAPHPTPPQPFPAAPAPPPAGPPAWPPTPGPGDPAGAAPGWGGDDAASGIAGGPSRSASAPGVPYTVSGGSAPVGATPTPWPSGSTPPAQSTDPFRGRPAVPDPASAGPPAGEVESRAW
jgi:hypothetical protein